MLVSCGKSPSCKYTFQSKCLNDKTPTVRMYLIDFEFAVPNVPKKHKSIADPFTIVGTQMFDLLKSSSEVLFSKYFSQPVHWVLSIYPWTSSGPRRITNQYSSRIISAPPNDRMQSNIASPLDKYLSGIDICNATQPWQHWGPEC